MRDSDKDFDGYIRSVLENAEEPAPPYVLDDVFRRMDEEAGKRQRRQGFPLWLRRSGIACAAAAAMTAVAIALWPDGRGAQTPEPEMTAELSADGLRGRGSDVGADVSDGQETIIVSAMQDSPDAAGGSYIADLLPEHSETEPSAAAVTETSGLPEADDVDAEGEGSAVSGVKNAATADAEAAIAAGADAIAGAAEETAEPSEAADAVTEVGTDEWQDETLFGDREEGRRAGAKVSMVVGGDVTSNGDPSGLKRSGGFKAPAVKYADGVRISQTNSESSYSIPVSVGVGVKIAFTEHWAIGTGVNYSLLQRTFAGKYTKTENGVIVKSLTSDIKHQLHYVGIPLNVYYGLIDSDKIKLYTYAGATAEKGILNAYRIKDASKYMAHKESVKGVQLSAGAGFGVEFMIVDQVGLYLDPGFRYYFDCDQPVNIRTQQPFMMSFEAGLRVAL